jgi:hypothetical protein
MDQNHEDYDQNVKEENPPRGAWFVLELVRVGCDGLKTGLGNRVLGGLVSWQQAARAAGAGLRAVKKEVGWMGHAGENKRFGPRPFSGLKPFVFPKLFSNLQIILELKSSLNFDDFYSHKTEALHHYEKKICKGMKCKQTTI